MVFCDSVRCLFLSIGKLATQQSRTGIAFWACTPAIFLLNNAQGSTRSPSGFIEIYSITAWV
jgi:hypothetical protein